MVVCKEPHSCISSQASEPKQQKHLGAEPSGSRRLCDAPQNQAQAVAVKDEGSDRSQDRKKQITKMKHPENAPAGIPPLKFFVWGFLSWKLKEKRHPHSPKNHTREELIFVQRDKDQKANNWVFLGFDLDFVSASGLECFSEKN